MTLHGAGASSCRDFAEILDAFRPFLDGTAHDVVAQRTTANYLQYEEWLEGYIFGIETNIRGYRRASRLGSSRHGRVSWNAALALFEMLSSSPDAK